MDREATVIPVDESGNRLCLSEEEITAVQTHVKHIESQLQLDDASFTSSRYNVSSLRISGQKINKTDDADEGNVAGADWNDQHKSPKLNKIYHENISKADAGYEQNIWHQDGIIQPNVSKAHGSGQFQTLGSGVHFSSDISNMKRNPDDLYTKADVVSEHVPAMMLVCDVNDPDFDSDGEKIVTMAGEKSMSMAGYVVSVNHDDTKSSYPLYKCPTCLKNFTSERYLAKHKQIHTADNFTCLECGKTFNLKGNLQKHMDTHSGKKQFKCEECGKEFLLKGNLKKHLLNHSGQKDYVCLVCQKKFVLKGNLQKHLATHIKPFDCEQCSESFSTQASLSRHMKSSHTEPSIFECHLCGKQFHFMRYLRQHMEVHQEGVLYSCSSCEQQFKTSALLKAHERKVHTEPTEECEICGKKFFTKQDLKRHADIHREDKPFWCEICGKGFLRKTALSKHLGTHKGFECDRCGASFSKEENLHQHKSVPCGDNLSCPICQQSFTRRANLKRHLQYHSGSRSFKCDICQQLFTRKESLQRHLMSHNDIKPHECDFCGKRFISAWNLKTHRFTHTGECPYKCTHCGKGFRSTWNRNIHMSTHTGHKPYTCRVCSTQFTTYTTMRRHVMTHYPHLIPQNVQLRNKKRKTTMQLVNAHHVNNNGPGSDTTNSESENNKQKKSFLKTRSRRVKFSLPPIRKPNKCSICGQSFWLLFNLQSHVTSKHTAYPSTSEAHTVGSDNSSCFTTPWSLQYRDKDCENLSTSAESDKADTEMQMTCEEFFLNKFSLKPISLAHTRTDDSSTGTANSKDYVLDSKVQNLDLRTSLADSLSGGSYYRKRQQISDVEINPVVESCDTQIMSKDNSSESGSSYKKMKRTSSNTAVNSEVESYNTQTHLTDIATENEISLTQHNIAEPTKTSGLESETELQSKSSSSEGDNTSTHLNIGVTSKQNLPTQEASTGSGFQHVSKKSSSYINTGVISRQNLVMKAEPTAPNVQQTNKTSKCISDTPEEHMTDGSVSSCVSDKMNLDKKNMSFYAECYICGKEFESSGQLKKHMKTHKIDLERM